MSHRSQTLRDSIYVELVRSLFATIAPSLIMSVGFVCSAVLLWLETRDLLLGYLGLIGSVASIVRMAFLLRVCGRMREGNLGAEQARRMERAFALTYWAFAVPLGLFGACALVLAPAQSQLLVMCLLIGYAAGVATGTGLRPNIAIPSMLAAILPPAAVLLLVHGGAVELATGLMMIAMLGGGIHSVRERHKAKVKEIGQRMTFALLARRDGLTDLPNRLALREWFETNVTLGSRPGIVAVHFLDLDGFKSINERYGHPAGDELLRAIADRLARSLRPGDIAARLGGDEFALVQYGLDHAEEAEFLAQRLYRSIATAFRIDGHEIGVSASIGYVTTDLADQDLEHLLQRADDALYSAKRGRQHIVGIRHDSPRSSRHAA